MKRVRINKGKVGLVFRDGDYLKALTAGSYWISSFWKLQLVDQSMCFEPEQDLDLFKHDQQLMSMLDIVEVGDGQLALHFVNNRLYEVLEPGEYAFWKTEKEQRFQLVNTDQTEIGDELPEALLLHPKLSRYLRILRLSSFERGLLYINDTFQRELEHGSYYFWRNQINVSSEKADMRETQLEVSGQELLTADKTSIRASLFVRYRVTDIYKALTENKDYSKQFYVAVQLALRDYVGGLTLDEVLERKEEVSEYVVRAVTEKAARLGLEVSDGGIRDIILPGDVRNIMSQVLIAQKKAQANVITRRDETASIRSMLNSAKLMEDNKMLFKLKEMEYVEKIADKINTISLSGGGQVLDQLRDIFSSSKRDE